MIKRLLFHDLWWALHWLQDKPWHGSITSVKIFDDKWRWHHGIMHTRGKSSTCMYQEIFICPKFQFSIQIWYRRNLCPNRLADCPEPLGSGIVWALYNALVDMKLKCDKKKHTHRTSTGINSLAPGKFEWNFRHVIFKQILVTDGWGISCEITLILMSLDFIDDQSTLVQIMAWCRQATSHYLSQCWPTAMSPNGVTRPQWVN